MARSRSNPFWVTPQGTAVHHTEKQFSDYRTRHPKRILPEQAAREADIEGAYADGRDAAPGTSIRPAHVDIKGKRATIYRVFVGNKDSGKYAMDRRKAVEISHRVAARANNNPHGERRTPTEIVDAISAYNKKTQTEIMNRVKELVKDGYFKVEAQAIALREVEKGSANNNPHHRSSPAALARAHVLNAATSFRQSGGLKNVKILNRARALGHRYDDEEIVNSGYVPYKAALQHARDAESAYNLEHTDANRPEMLERARQLAAAYDYDERANDSYAPYQAGLRRAYEVESAYNADRFDTNRSGMLDYARQLGAAYDAEDNPFMGNTRKAKKKSRSGR